MKLPRPRPHPSAPWRSRRDATLGYLPEPYTPDVYWEWTHDRILEGVDPLGVLGAIVQHYNAPGDQGCWVGTTTQQDPTRQYRTFEPIFTPGKLPVLVVGPPQVGKTASIVIPNVFTHDGPVVVTSTKADVMAATAGFRGALGPVWVLDPFSVVAAPSFARELIWTPVASVTNLATAMSVARRIRAGATARDGTEGQNTYWYQYAENLLTAMLLAASYGGRSMADVLKWVRGSSLTDRADSGIGVRGPWDQPVGILVHAKAAAPDAETALQSLDSMLVPGNPPGRVTAANLLLSWLAVFDLPEMKKDPGPNAFNADEFVRGRGVVYVISPEGHQQLLTPVVTSFLREIKEATIRAFNASALPARVMLILDEAANIAPWDELPGVITAGTSQGINLIVTVQTLQQARTRWPDLGADFVGAFSVRIAFPGIADAETLQAFSNLMGNYVHRDILRGHHGGQHGWTEHVEVRSVMEPGDVATVGQGFFTMSSTDQRYQGIAGQGRYYEHPLLRSTSDRYKNAQHRPSSTAY